MDFHDDGCEECCVGKKNEEKKKSFCIEWRVEMRRTKKKTLHITKNVNINAVLQDDKQPKKPNDSNKRSHYLS